MNIFIDYLIPAFIIVIANIFSDKHESVRYEIVTGIFDWAGVFSLVITVILFFIDFYHPSLGVTTAKEISTRIMAFSLTAAFSRDYEKNTY